MKKENTNKLIESNQYVAAGTLIYFLKRDGYLSVSYN